MKARQWNIEATWRILRFADDIRLRERASTIRSDFLDELRNIRRVEKKAMNPAAEEESLKE